MHENEKKITCSSAGHYICARCTDVADGGRKKKNQWRYYAMKWMEIVKEFCYLGDRLNASGGCETAVTLKVRIGRMKFRECIELLRR